MESVEIAASRPAARFATPNREGKAILTNPFSATRVFSSPTLQVGTTSVLWGPIAGPNHVHRRLQLHKANFGCRCK